MPNTANREDKVMALIKRMRLDTLRPKELVELAEALLTIAKNKLP